MTIFTFANNVNTTLAGPVSTGATTITLASTANLPATIPAGEVLVITLNDAATRQNFEVVYATARTGATLTVLRAQEGTSALAWLTGDYSFSPPTAGQQESFGQLASGNTWTGANTFAAAISTPAVITPLVQSPSSPLLIESNGAISFVNPTGTAFEPINCGPATLSQSAVTLGQLTSFGGNGNSSTGGTSISAQVTFTAPQNCVIFAIGSGANANPITAIQYAVSNANIVFQGGNFATASGGSNNVAPAYGVFTASAGASVLLRLNMSYVTSSLQNVNFMYFLLPTP